MSQIATATIIEHFGKLEDPRRYNKRHVLIAIVVIAICAVICGADNWPTVAEFGEAKQEWFEEFLELPHGIPADDTFRRVFTALDAEQFQSCFLTWVKAMFEVTQGQVVPSDGKKLRHSYDKRLGKDAIHMVSAWTLANHLVLGQVKVDAKSNEITALPQLLEVLEIAGCIVTIDAIGCQKKIIQKIKAKQADYTIAVNANQKGLLADITGLFERARETQFANCDYYKTEEKGHGRFEIRECWTLAPPEDLKHIRSLADWTGLQMVVMVRRERHIGDKRETEIKYYSSSLASSAPAMLAVIRGHWGLENQLHWVLDSAFREDDCRLPKGIGPQNFALLRHIALNLLKQESTCKRGIKTKRLKAGWDLDYLSKVLAG